MALEPPTPDQPIGERICANCGAQLPDNHRYCTTCGTEVAPTTAVTPPPRFCPHCGTPLQSAYRYCTNCGTDVAAISGTWDEPVGPGSRYPVRFDVQYPEKLSRLLIFVKIFLVIPHFLIVYALGYVTAVITFIAFFAILFTRRYPRGLFNIVVGFNRWGANVYSYVALLRDEYPPFSTDPGRYPVVYEVDYPERLSRWPIFIKWLLIIPHQFVIGLLSIFAFLFYVLAWFGILFTGRYNRTFFNFIVGLMRWNLRVSAYSALLRDEFPPYSKRADSGPGSGKAVALSAIFGVVGLVAIVAGFVALPTVEPETRTVDVSYQRVLSGGSTETVSIGGTEVTLRDVEDPYIAQPGSGRVDTGSRLVAFELVVRNEDSLFTSVGVETFELEDTMGDRRQPWEVFALSALDSAFLDRGEDAHILVVFEVDRLADPATLTYSPRFVEFFGTRVRFVFR